MSLRTTRYFDATRQRPDRAAIRDEWIEPVIRNPLRQQVQTDGRIRRWAPIADAGGRYLRVVLLPDGTTVHNAFFDRIRAMKIRYFGDTDTLYIELRPGDVTDTRDLDEDTLLEFDARGQVVAITIEHAQARAQLPTFSYEQIAA